MSRSPRATACALAAALLAAVPADSLGESGQDCPDADLTPTLENVERVETATLCLVNVERVRRGRSTLGRSGRLRLAAVRHSRDMVEQRYFSHQSRSGRGLVARVRVTGYLRGEWALGENLAYGSPAFATPRSTVERWMDSPGHRDNLLERDFEDAGIGVAPGMPVEGRSGGATYTADLGMRELSRAGSSR